jgi:hypothetical protein
LASAGKARGDGIAVYAPARAYRVALAAIIGQRSVWGR